MGPVSIGVEVQRNTDGDTPSIEVYAMTRNRYGQDSNLSVIMTMRQTRLRENTQATQWLWYLKRLTHKFFIKLLKTEIKEEML